MSAINEALAAKLVHYRKQAHLTQERLAERLGVTFQAISKWETAKSAPDIALLPLLADVFGCRIDDLFGRSLASPTVVGALPWNNDADYHAAIFKGHTMIDTDEALRDFTLTINAETVDHLIIHGNGTLHGSVHACCEIYGDLELQGTLLGNCSAKGNITCEGKISGDVEAKGNIVCGDVVGDCHARGNLVAVDVSGDCCSQGAFTAADIHGDCASAANISAGTLNAGSVSAGNVHVQGNAAFNNEVHCGILECGSISKGTIIIEKT